MNRVDSDTVDAKISLFCEERRATGFMDSEAGIILANPEILMEIIRAQTEIAK